MVLIRVPKGVDLNFTGKPSLNLTTLQRPAQVAATPARIPFIKPRLKVEEGAVVKIGSLLMEDKRQPEVVFRSPGGGVVESIRYGPRRVIEEVVIALDETEAFEEFPAFSESRLQELDREALVNIICAGGLWPLFRELPFRDYPRPETVPPAIFVVLDAKEPFQPSPAAYLSGKAGVFQYGIRVLEKLCPQVYVCTSRENRRWLAPFFNGYAARMITHVYKGKYPADDPGVLLYHTKRSASENRSWYIGGADVLLLSHLLAAGNYPVERTVCVAGDAAPRRGHFRTRQGAPLRHLAPNAQADGGVRYVMGGLFRGSTTPPGSFMGLLDTALTLLPEGRYKELFGFLKPGAQKPSHSRAFLSVLDDTPKPTDTNIHGDARACINCGTCDKVCPVDILPQYAMKSIHADELEDALAHGMLDCVECGACTYVCPSKIELCDIIKEAKRNYMMEEQAAS